MWNHLKLADIEQAKREIIHRRAETLSRQAREREALEADRAAVENLRRLVDAFSRTFATSAIAPLAAPAVEESVPPPLAEEAASPAIVEEAALPVIVQEMEPLAIIEQIATPPGPAPWAGNVVSNGASGGRPYDPRDYPQTNFGVFSRAIQKSTF